MSQSNLLHHIEGEVSSFLKAWELDPNFRNYCRAVPLEDFTDEQTYCSALYDPTTQFKNFLEPIKVIETTQEQSEMPMLILKPIGHNPVLCPSCPSSLFNTHLKIHLENHRSVHDIIQTISILFEAFPEYDFTYVESLSTWKGKYINGSLCCVLSVHLFCDIERVDESTNYSAPTEYIVEANRISGDAKPFYTFFSRFRALLMTQETTPNTFYMPDSDTTSSSLQRPSPCQAQPPNSTESLHLEEFHRSHSQVLSGLDFLHSIAPILKLAKESPYYESKLEAARMLCDVVASHEQAEVAVGEPAFASQLVEALNSLVVHSGFSAVKEQAIITLGRYVDIPGYARYVVRTEMVSLLLYLVANPPDPLLAFECLQLRRECARIMTILVSCDPHAVLEKLEVRKASGSKALNRWMSTVDGILDMRTRMHAQRLRSSLLKAWQKG